MLASFRDLTASISLHHNLFASSRERHPTLGGSPRTDAEAVVDFRNNIVYNVSGATNLGNCRINMINNFYCPGPDTPPQALPLAAKTENVDALKVFLTGNVFEGRPELTGDNHLAIDFQRWAKGNYLTTTWDLIRADQPFPVGAAQPATESATEAAELVLRYAGDSRRRDAADTRIVAGVRDRTHHMIDSQQQVGGWPALRSEPSPKDTDQDGMPDVWEEMHHLNPSDPDDRNGDPDHDGFTNLEVYLNGLCPI